MKTYRIMRLLSAVFFGVFACLALQAQVINNVAGSDCEIQVAFAISETEGTGEYAMTEFVTLPPGSSHDFRDLAFARRQLFAGEDYEEMFIIRFPSSGITHFVDANVPDGYETLLNGGCSLGQMPRLSRDGEFHIDTRGYSR